jgi:hypothetical protein
MLIFIIYLFIYLFIYYSYNDKNISTFNISHILGLYNKWSHSLNPFIEPKGLSTIIKNTHHSWNGIKINFCIPI